MSLLTKSYIPEKMNFGIDSRFGNTGSILYPVSDNQKKNKEYVDKIKIKSKDDNIKVFDNKPISGFRINNFHGLWYITDPRGFDMQVQGTVLNALITQCVIDHGEIISKCVWAWNSKPVLLSEDFEEYKAALNNTAQVAFKIKDLEIGDIFNFNNENNDLIFLGKYYKNDISNDISSIYENYRNKDKYNHNVYRYSDIDVKYFYYDTNLKRTSYFSSGKGIFNISKQKISEDDLKKYLENYPGKLFDSRPKTYLEITDKAFAYINADKNNVSNLVKNNIILGESKNIKNGSHYLNNCHTMIFYIDGEYYIGKKPNSSEILGYSNLNYINLDHLVFSIINREDINQKLKHFEIKNKDYDYIITSCNQNCYRRIKNIEKKIISIVDIISKSD